MVGKKNVLANIFLYHKALLKQYADVLKTAAEKEKHFSLVWPDGAIFAVVELRHLSVAWFINRVILPVQHQLPRELGGTMDKEGWLHLSTNREIYLVRIKEELSFAYKSGKPDRSKTWHREY